MFVTNKNLYIIKDSLRLKHINDSLLSKIKVLERDDSNIRYINAIGAQWPFLLVIILASILIVYRKKIETFLGRTRSFKGAAAGVSLEIIQDEAKGEMTTNTENAISRKNENWSLETGALETAEDSFREPILFDTYVELKNGNETAAKKIFDTVQSSIDDVSVRERNKFIYQHFRYVNGMTDSIFEIVQIKEHSDSLSTKALADYHLCLCYTYSGNFEKAIEYAQKSIDLCIRENLVELLPDILLGVTDAYIKSGKEKEYIKLLFLELKKHTDSQILFRLYRKIGDVFYSNKQNVESLAALLKANSLISNDAGLLFTIAYGASEIGFNELSLQLYELRDKLKKDNAATENNLAVAYDNLEIKSKAITFFKKSYNNGNSLAASNLANKYISMGFIEESKEILNNVKANYPDINPSIWKSFNTLDESLVTENEKLKKVYDVSFSIKLFFERYIDALNDYVLNSMPIILSQYKWDNHPNKVSTDLTKISIEFSTSIITIELGSSLKPVGECTAVDFYKTGHPYKNETYKGFYYFGGDQIKVMLKYEYYNSRQEMLFFDLTRTEMTMVEA